MSGARHRHRSVTNVPQEARFPCTGGSRCSSLTVPGTVTEACRSCDGSVSCAFESVRDRLELAPIALELRALGGDHLGRRALDEAVVRELLLRARDLLPQAIPLALDVPVAGDGRAIRPDDRVEDPLLLALERRLDAG